jgi:hypothetical protein
MAGKFKRFRKPRYCPGASATGFRKWAVSEGDLVRYREEYADGSHGSRLARVLGLATHGGDGTEYPGPRLAVLAANDMLTCGYERHVAIEDVEEVLDPSQGRDFARWFLFGTVPGPELAYAVSEYGAMSDSYLGKYLTAPEGEVRKDWRDVDRAKVGAADE